MEPGRLRRTTTGTTAQAGEDRRVRMLALHVEISQVECRTGAGHGDAFTAERLDRPGWIKALNEDECGPRHETGQQVDGPSDMGNRESESAAVRRHHL